MGHVRPHRTWKGPCSNYVPQLDQTTNRHFAKTNAEFIVACELAKVLPTKDQARRWKQKKGAAYRAVHS